MAQADITSMIILDFLITDEVSRLFFGEMKEVFNWRIKYEVL